METLKRLMILAIVVAMIWFSAAVVAVTVISPTIQDGAVLLAFLTTLILGLVAGLDQLGRRDKPAAAPAKKAKRGGESDADARVALLLSMLSERERESIKARLLDDITADGEALSLAELLATQEREQHMRR